LLVAGCHEGSAPPALAPSLQDPLEVSAAQPSADTKVSFTVASWKEGSATRLDVAPTDLRLVFHTGKKGEITGLELPLADQDISAQAIPPNGLKLRNLQLGLDSTVELATQSSSEDFVELHAIAPLRLAWSVVLEDGSVYALGPAITQPMAFDVELERHGDDVTARVYAKCDGDCWSLDGVAHISDGNLHLVAPATIKPLE
jgi:hypothetical protein